MLRHSSEGSIRSDLGTWSSRSRHIVRNAATQKPSREILKSISLSGYNVFPKTSMRIRRNPQQPFPPSDSSALSSASNNRSFQSLGKMNHEQEQKLWATFKSMLSSTTVGSSSTSKLSGSGSAAAVPDLQLKSSEGKESLLGSSHRIDLPLPPKIIRQRQPMKIESLPRHRSDTSQLDFQSNPLSHHYNTSVPFVLEGGKHVLRKSLSVVPGCASKQRLSKILDGPLNKVIRVQSAETSRLVVPHQGPMRAVKREIVPKVSRGATREDPPGTGVRKPTATANTKRITESRQSQEDTQQQNLSVVGNNKNGFQLHERRSSESQVLQRHTLSQIQIKAKSIREVMEDPLVMKEDGILSQIASITNDISPVTLAKLLGEKKGTPMDALKSKILTKVVKCQRLLASRSSSNFVPTSTSSQRPTTTTRRDFNENGFHLHQPRLEDRSKFLSDVGIHS